MTDMIEEKIEIPLADGTSEAFLYHAETGRRPGVLFLTDIVGIREANRGMARRLAEAGYTVLMPNLFYRTGRLPMFDFPVKFGEERTDKQALAAWGGCFESEVYAGAHHGWTVPGGPVYDEPQAERAFRKLTGLLSRRLRPEAPL